MKKLTRLEKIAYHEAGHAVTHYFLKIPFKYVTIQEKGNSLGHTKGFPNQSLFKTDADLNGKLRTRAEKEIMICFAGIVSEAIITGRNNWQVGCDDKDGTVELAIRMCGSSESTSAFLKWMWIRTNDWIKQPLHWKATEALVKELLKRNEISAKEVRKIISRSIFGKL